jgi:hypothetical protein
MELPKLGIRNIYLFEPKWAEMNTANTHLKEEWLQKNLLILEDYEAGKKNEKIVHLEKI